MSDQNARLAETAVRIINEDLVLPLRGAGKRVTIYLSPLDAVSPLTVPEARRVLFAKSVAALLFQSGYLVRCHSLFADYQEPVRNLTVSIWLRYLELCGEEVAYPEECYQGDYIFDFAATVHRTYGDQWRIAANEVAQCLSQANACHDGLFSHIQVWLGEAALSTIKRIGLQSIGGDIHHDLRDMDVGFEQWPRASALLCDGSVRNMIERCEVKGLVHTESGRRYFTLPAQNKQLLENEAGPTPFAIQLSHFLSVFPNDGVSSDLNICIYDIDEAEQLKAINDCARLLGCCAVVPMTEKPLSSLQLYEFGDFVHTSARAEDFVSYREVGQAIGRHSLQWLFGVHQSGEAMSIDLSGKHHDLCVERYGRIAQNTVTPERGCNTKQWKEVLGAFNPNQQQAVQSFLQVFAEFDDIVEQAIQTLEPALLINYYRNLCERFLSYYNNHELIAADHPKNTHDNVIYLDEHCSADWIVAVMILALQRFKALVDPIIGFPQTLTHDTTQ